MRVFMLVQTPGARGPVPKHTAHLVSALRSFGCTVVTHPWGRRRQQESLPGSLIRTFRDVRSIGRALRYEAFDVAVVKTSHDWHTLARDLVAAAIIRRRCRPVVLQLHGSRASWLTERGRRPFKLVSALLLSLADAVLVLSTEEQRQFTAFRQGLPVFTVKNPYLSIVSEPEAGPSLNGTRLLFVGRLIEEKGIFDLLEALVSVTRDVDCHLHVVGAGDQRREVQERISRLGLEGRVTMKGYLSSPELSEEYRGSAMLVLPTRWDEGFPTVLAEAMDAGLPIITTPIRGAADHLVEEENALFVQPRDVPGLASAIRRLLRDDALRARMAAANRERVRIFEPNVVAAEYLQVLQTIAGSAALSAGKG
jgi:glycosyltransferase involved in cell wall biosynthesis